MAETPVDEQTPAPEPTMDVDAAVQDIAESLHLTEAEEPGQPETEEPPAQGAGVEKDQAPPEGEAPAAGVETPTPATASQEWIPSTWRKEAMAEWAGLPPGVKAEIQKREGDIANYVANTNMSVKVAQGIEEVIKPYAELYSKYGVNPWQHMKDLLQAHHTMLFGAPQQKAALFAEIARNTGVDLKALSEGTPQQAGGEQYLEQVRTLQQRIAQLEQGVGSVAGTVQEARLTELTESVMAFAQDPKHPFFDEVAEDIKALIDAGAARTLTDAYETAVARNPQVRAKLVDQELAARRAAEDKTDGAHAARARKALGGMPKSSGKGRGTAPAETIDDTLRKTLARINAREAS